MSRIASWVLLGYRYHFYRRLNRFWPKCEISEPPKASWYTRYCVIKIGMKKGKKYFVTDTTIFFTHKNFTRQCILMIMHYIHLPFTVFIYCCMLPFPFCRRATNKLYLSWNMKSVHMKRINIVSVKSSFYRRARFLFVSIIIIFQM